MNCTASCLAVHIVHFNWIHLKEQVLIMCAVRDGDDAGAQSGGEKTCYSMGSLCEVSVVLQRFEIQDIPITFFFYYYTVFLHHDCNL